jgi:UPF0755 protein
MNLRKRGRAGLLLLLAGLLAAGFLWQQYQQFRSSPLDVPEAGLVLDFQPGSTLRGLAQDLAARGVLAHPHWLRLLGRETGLAARLQAGEYRIEPGTTPEGLLRQLAAGRVLQHELTLVEGHTFREMMERLRAHPALVQSLADFPTRRSCGASAAKGNIPRDASCPIPTISRAAPPTWTSCAAPIRPWSWY